MQRTFKPGQNVSRLEAKFNVQFLVVRGGLTVILTARIILNLLASGQVRKVFHKKAVLFGRPFCFITAYWPMGMPCPGSVFDFNSVL
ncbi:MAG TPA: hypothetical protein PKU74_04630 [Candidatus Omnitrophota bacterium]|nr:hypothetical protein [Candidatus Omnitrophota bacterium]